MIVNGQVVLDEGAAHQRAPGQGAEAERWHLGRAPPMTIRVPRRANRAEELQLRMAPLAKAWPGANRRQDERDLLLAQRAMSGMVPSGDEVRGSRLPLKAAVISVP